MDVDEDWEEWNPTKGKFVHHMMAGSIAGMIEHFSIFPIDTVKTYMQCQRCPINGTPTRLSAMQTCRELVASEGPLRLFRGVSAMFGASIPAHAAYFSIFEACKITFGADGPDHTPVAAGASGICATAAHDLIMTPMDVVKQRLQLGYYSGAIDCLRRIVSHEGLKALYISFPTTLFMNLPYGMVLVSSNESIKLLLNPSGEHNVPVFFISGALSGAIAGAVTNPLDVVKTRLQTQLMLDESSAISCPRVGSSGVVLDMPSSCGGRSKNVSKQAIKHGEPHLQLEYKGLIDAIKKIKANEGYAGFFRGVGPRLLVHTPSVAVSWTTYEMTKNILSKIDD